MKWKAYIAQLRFANAHMTLRNCVHEPGYGRERKEEIMKFLSWEELYRRTLSLQVNRVCTCVP